METQPSIAMTESPTQQQVSLPHSVEHLMSKICVEQSQPPPDPSARRMLASVGEESALEILRSIAKSKIRYTFSGFITHMVKNLNNNGSPLKRVCLSPSQQNRSPVTTVRLMNSPQGTDEAVNSSQQRGSSSSSLNPRAATTMRTSIPQYVALGELDFRKAFLILSYIGEKSLEEVTTADEIRRLKDLHMHLFEAEVWKAFGVNYIKPEDRRRVHHNAAKFRREGIDPAMMDKLDRMFMNITATGDHAWAPSSGVLLSDSSNTDTILVESTADSDDSIPVDVTQSVEKGGNTRMVNKYNTLGVRDRKGKNIVARGGGKVKASAKLLEHIDVMIDAINTKSIAASQVQNDKVCSITEVMQKLVSKTGLKPSDELWLFASRLFSKKDRREVFSLLEDPEDMLTWLRYEKENSLA